MPAGPEHLFLPGWGAPAHAYDRGLPAGWVSLETPSFRRAGGSIDAYVAWLLDEMGQRPGPVVLGGHSMGGALALLAAARAPERVERLVLVSPAGLPLVKPMVVSGLQFVQQLVEGRFERRDALRAAAQVAVAPRSALAIARAVRSLDLSYEMERVRAAGTTVTVIGCATDTLVTAASCRRAASLLGARYRELRIDGGHTWMFRSWQRFGTEISTV